MTTGGTKSVCWGDLTVYEFPNLLGDNPAVSDGAPLTIGWTHESMRVVAIEYHEFLRQSRPRRRRKDMIVTTAQRDTVRTPGACRADEWAEEVVRNCSRTFASFQRFVLLRLQFLLGMGYSLDQIVNAAEESRKIRKSRQANMKGVKTWNKFKQVFEGATRGLRRASTQEPKILAAKCG